MPEKPLRPCIRSGAGCPNLTKGGYCEACEPIHGRAAQEQARGSAASRGYGHKWRKESQVYLREHPFCECAECKQNEMPELADVVDHIVPHKGDQKLFWSRSNWAAMSKRHHDKKTARENGGLGNPVRPGGR